MAAQDAPRVILVMGVTGVGKSTFIQTATGHDVVVGHTQEACTSKVELFPIPGSNIFLLDSPGFDDTYRNDGTILQAIDECLADMYSQRAQIAGVLYLHPITEVRMKGSAMKNLRVFSKVVGMKNMHKCRLVTTKWSLQEAETSERRERELGEKKEFWKPLLDKGAEIVRFDDSQQSAFEIIQQVCGDGFVPQLTKETQEKGIPLARTAAGQEVNEDLEEARKAHSLELHELRQQQEQAIKDRDLETAALVKEARDEVAKQLAQIEQERNTLNEKRTHGRGSFAKWLGVGAGVLGIAASVTATVLTGGAAATSIPLSVAGLGVAFRSE